MSIESGRVVPFIIMWGIPTFMIIRAYLKMGEDDRNSVKGDFKKPRFIFTIGFVLIGLLLSQLGSIFSIELINVIGIIILAIGGLVSVIDIWKGNKIKSIISFLLLMIAVYLLYG